jgi:hypothetical protein
MVFLFQMITMADFKEHWWLYLSMPIIASVIGYGTKIVAIKMMFEPLEFFWHQTISRLARHYSAQGSHHEYHCL